jgi:hypothetical protein
VVEGPYQEQVGDGGYYWFIDQHFLGAWNNLVLYSLTPAQLEGELIYDKKPAATRFTISQLEQWRCEQSLEDTHYWRTPSDALSLTVGLWVAEIASRLTTLYVSLNESFVSLQSSSLRRAHKRM